MARLKYDKAGKGRNRGYFPQLKGLGDALRSMTPTGIADPVPKGADEVAELRSKQAAKLARRAARAHA